MNYDNYTREKYPKKKMIFRNKGFECIHYWKIFSFILFIKNSNFKENVILIIKNFQYLGKH